VPAVCGEGVVKRVATAQRLERPGSDGERPQQPLPVTLLVGPSTSGKTMGGGLVDGPTMDTTARSVGEPQQSELVSQRVWSRVATFTELLTYASSASGRVPRVSATFHEHLDGVTLELDAAICWPALR
jgi:hypothetical protein